MGTLLRKVLSDSFIYAVLPRLSRILSILIMPVITRYLTPYDYGVTGILFAYIHIFEGFRNLGLDVVFINSYFKENEHYKEIWEKLLGFLTIWAIPYGLLLVPIAYIAIPFEERSIFSLIIIFVVCPIVFFDQTIDLGQKYLQVNRKPFPFSLISLVSALVVLISNYVTIVHYRMGFMGFIVSDFMGKGVTFTYYFFLVFIKLRFIPRFNFSYQWLRDKLTIAIPTIPHAYAGYILNTSDRVLLNLFHVSVSSIGLYAFAYSFGTNFSKLGQSILVAGRPIMMGLFAKEDRISELQARNLVWLLQAGLLSCGFLLSLWMREIILLLASNGELHAAYAYAIPIIMTYTYYPIYIGAINKLYYFEKTRIFWKISFVAAIINLGLNVILIPMYGIWGSVLTTFLSYMFMGFSAYRLKEFREVNSVNYREIPWLIATCTLTGAVFLMKEASILLKSEITLLFVLGWAIFYFMPARSGNWKIILAEKYGSHD